jgi:hypothetical protein
MPSDFTGLPRLLIKLELRNFIIVVLLVLSNFPVECLELRFGEVVVFGLAISTCFGVFI